METYQIVRLAICGHAKQIKEAFYQRGKLVSVQWITRQGRPPADVNFRDFYGAFILWLTVIRVVNPAGVLLIVEDLCLRMGMWDAETGGLRFELTETEREDFETRAAFLSSDPMHIRHELHQDIERRRRLLALPDDELMALQTTNPPALAAVA